jgi:hypothetical protein
MKDHEQGRVRITIDFDAVLFAQVIAKLATVVISLVVFAAFGHPVC